MMMAGGPPEKLEDFKGSTKRLLRLLKPQRVIVAGALVSSCRYSAPTCSDTPPT
jgi:putative component of membrane protein insertase Oxa1/YidC/SpoIIIJ protein YidD